MLKMEESKIPPKVPPQVGARGLMIGLDRCCSLASRHSLASIQISDCRAAAWSVRKGLGRGPDCFATGFTSANLDCQFVMLADFKGPDFGLHSSPVHRA